MNDTELLEVLGLNVSSLSPIKSRRAKAILRDLGIQLATFYRKSSSTTQPSLPDVPELLDILGTSSSSSADFVHNSLEPVDTVSRSAPRDTSPESLHSDSSSPTLSESSTSSADSYQKSSKKLKYHLPTPTSISFTQNRFRFDSSQRRGETIVFEKELKKVYTLY